jgi:hypothetical protein
MRGPKKRSPAEERRRAARREARAKQDAMADRTLGDVTTTWMLSPAYAVGDRIRTPEGMIEITQVGAADEAPRRRRHAREITSRAFLDPVARLLGAWQVERAYKGGPLRIADPTLLRAAAQPKARALRSPTWLHLVRLMPCLVPGCTAKGHRPIHEQFAHLATAKPQSDPNHYPGKGRDGGGSDFETHPACRRCHTLITDRRLVLPSRAETLEGMQHRLVAQTQGWILLGFHTGRLRPELLLACAVEAMING